MGFVQFFSFKIFPYKPRRANLKGLIIENITLSFIFVKDKALLLQLIF